MNIPSIRGLCAGVVLAALWIGAAPVAAAQQGTVAGRVTDQTTQQPVSGAQVIVEGSALRTQTNQEGRYRIEKLSPGQYRLQVRLIGYATTVRPVTVAAGEAAQLDFTLSAAPVSLEAITITGPTGEDQRAREVANTVSHVDAAKRAAEAPVTNLSDLLNSQAPGVTVMPSGGTTGTGTRIRVRGATSLSLSNEPILVVDGVRVDNEPQGFRTGTNAGAVGVGGQSPSRLNDINNEDIESIDIVKGPAATSLYGTDAVNGAIIVRTKRGRPGPTTWSAFTEGGTVNDHTDWPANFKGVDAANAFCPLTGVAAGTCTQSNIQSFNPLKVNSPFQTGSRQQYGASASGGNEATTFYVAGDFEREKGVYHPNDLRRVNLRANLRNQVSRLFDIAVQTGYVSSRVRLPENDNNALGLTSSGLLGNADTTNLGYGFITPQQSFNIVSAQDIERFTGSVTANFRPWSFLSLRGVAGTDVTNRLDTRTFPPGQVPFNQNTLDGSRAANRAQTSNYTANFNATASFRLSPTITSTSSAGLQYFKDVFAVLLASGRKLTAGTNSLTGVVIPAVDENTDEFVTIGGYAQEEIGIRDRLFFTAALRNDRNSAFGSKFGNIIYPKVGASWVISEEPFFPRIQFLRSLRLRTAWGQSGRQPGPTDALQYFNAVPVTVAGTDVPGLTVGNLGNPALKPERTREWEAGLDADLWHERVHLEFTYYDKASKDALIARNLAPSLGVSSSRFENLGRVSNKGVEIMANAVILNRPNVAWSVTANAWGNRNRLIELGPGIKPIIFGLGGASQAHVPGYPLGGYWMVPFTFADANGDGIIGRNEITLADTAHFLGAPVADHGGTVSTEVTLWRRVRVSGLLDGRFGNKLLNDTEEFRCEFLICQAINDPKASLADQARAVAVITTPATEAGFVEDGGFVKLREISVTFMAPDKWARGIGASTLTFTVSGRNLATWTNYRGIDPELNEAGQNNFTVAEFLTQPPTRYFLARIAVTF